MRRYGDTILVAVLTFVVVAVILAWRPGYVPFGSEAEAEATLLPVIVATATPGASVEVTADVAATALLMPPTQVTVVPLGAPATTD